MDYDEMIMVAALCVLKKRKRKRNNRAVRSKWMKNWLLRRNEFSHTNLLEELRLNDPNDFRNYLRMNEDTYVELLKLVTPHLTKKNTLMRESITVHERLTATLRYLATGRTYEDLKYSCAISKQSLSQIIPETCYVIYRILKNEYLKFPSTTDDWLKIAAEFEQRWQFPHCLGCVDGKHVSIVPPADGGSFYYNYKGGHSLVLMAIANANYEFIMVSFGTNGRISDGGVIANTTFYTKLLNNSLNLPVAEQEGSAKDKLNYVFLSDEAFTLRNDFLKPYNQRELNYSKRIFNYRLSRARRVVENTFGILANRFRIFGKPIPLQLENTDIVVLACCALHNFLSAKSRSHYTPPDVFDFENHENGEVTLGYRTSDQNMPNLQVGNKRNSSKSAKAVRDQFKTYFNGEGAVPWQHTMVTHNSEILYNDENEERLQEEAVDDVEPLNENGRHEADDTDGEE